MCFEHDGTSTPVQMMENYENTTHPWRPSEGCLALYNPTLVKKTFFDQKHVFPKMIQDHIGALLGRFEAILHRFGCFFSRVDILNFLVKGSGRVQNGP